MTASESLVDFSQTGDALGIAIIILIIGLYKAFAAYISYRCPSSVVLLLCGIVTGGILYFSYTEKQLTLNPKLFFEFLLPVIVLEAGFCMRNKDFFSNIGTISVYAVIGTLVNIAILAAFLDLSKSLFYNDFSFIEILRFSVAACAVDPVAVITVFDDMRVNTLLYICVFGESLLNDAVTIVCHHGLEHVEVLGYAEVLSIVFNFFVTIIIGVVMGILSGYITTALCKVPFPMVQPVMLLFIQWIAYLLTETIHGSGIICLIVSGMITKNYTVHIIPEMMMQFTEVGLKMICSFSEAFIFVFLGISLPSHVTFDWMFLLFTLIGITIARIFQVFVLTAIVNRFRSKGERISLRDQVIMAYGGLRGAVCYGLIMSFTTPNKDILISTTIAMILFTTIAQGATIKYVVRWLQVRLLKEDLPEKKDYKIFALIHREVQKRVIAFMEDLTEYSEHPKFYRKFMEFDERYLKRFLIPNYNARDEIAERIKLIEIEEYTEGVKAGSFAGLPYVSSAARLHPHDSSHALEEPCPLGNGATGEGKTVKFNLTGEEEKEKAHIPRNESVSGFVQHTFDTLEQLLHNQRAGRRSVYSRHKMDSPASPGGLFSSSDGEDEDTSYLFTYPGPRPVNVTLGEDIKAWAAQRFRTGRSPSRRRPASVHEHRLSVPTSVGRPTAAPPHSASLKMPKVPRVHIVENEQGNTDPTPTQRSVRKLNSGGKLFVVGEEEGHELLPIREDHQEDDNDSSREEKK